MKKIPSLFIRDWDNDPRYVTTTVDPQCQWVIDGEGTPTRKWDGTCCLVQDGKLFKRYDAKHGKTPPPSFLPAQPSPDEKTGHWPGWLPVGDGPEDKWHREGWQSADSWEDGTYELCGPKVGGNPEGFDTHVLIRHGGEVLEDVRAFNDIRDYLRDKGIEGIVWHHEDGRMSKIKRRDFMYMNGVG